MLNKTYFHLAIVINFLVNICVTYVILMSLNGNSITMELFTFFLLIKDYQLRYLISLFLNNKNAFSNKYK